jgi:hypothetical protein
MANSDFRYAVIPLKNQWAIANRFPPQGLVQIRAEGIFAQNSDNERSSGFGKRLCRPIHELGKVEQENRFDLVLA